MMLGLNAMMSSWHHDPQSISQGILQVKAMCLCRLTSHLPRKVLNMHKINSPKKGITCERPSQRHALFLQLRHPRADASVGLVVLVVLIQRQAEELAALHALRLSVPVAASIHIAHHLGSCSAEGLVQLLDAIAEVVPIALGITATEDGYGLAIQAQFLDLVDEVVPRSAGAVLVGASVPSGATHNEPIEFRQVLGSVFANIFGLDPDRLGNLSCGSLSVAGLRSE